MFFITTLGVKTKPVWFQTYIELTSTIVNEPPTVPVFGVCDGVDDGIVDCWSFGYHSRYWIHIWCEHIRIPEKNKRID